MSLINPLMSFDFSKAFSSKKKRKTIRMNLDNYLNTHLPVVEVIRL